MKTVLHLSSTSGPGGAERVVCALAASLDQARFRSIVALFRPGWLKEQCEGRGIRTYVLPDDGLLNWRWMRSCYRLIREERVDVVQTHEFDANVHGMVVAAMAQVPMVATIHGKHYFWERARRRAAYRALSRYAKVVAVSEDLKRFIVDRVGIPETRIEVIHNGIELPPTVSRDEVEQVRSELALPNGAPVIGSVGSLYPVKGHRFLIEAMPEILARHPTTILLLVGRGDQETALKEQVRQLGIERQVRFLGLRQDVPRLLAVMDVFVLPSLSEGLSVALLEAMAMGKPVVATRVGGNAEVIREGETGWLVPPLDGKQLAMRLCELLGDQALMERTGKAARDLAKAEFGSSRMTEQYEALYVGAK